MNTHKHFGKYLSFVAMIGTSMVAMFLLTYLNSIQILNHAWFSETRLFMTLIMGGSMIIIMLTYMLHMYQSRFMNTFLFVTGAIMICSGIWLVRSQSTVDDVDYMQGMIPHHSIAILTSDRAKIRDLRVRDLAENIADAQRREIKEMQWLIADIKNNGPAVDRTAADERPVPNFSAAAE